MNKTRDNKLENLRSAIEGYETELNMLQSLQRPKTIQGRVELDLRAQKIHVKLQMTQQEYVAELSKVAAAELEEERNVVDGKE